MKKKGRKSQNEKKQTTSPSKALHNITDPSSAKKFVNKNFENYDVKEI